jgi:hypothetical protein
MSRTFFSESVVEYDPSKKRAYRFRVVIKNENALSVDWSCVRRPVGVIITEEMYFVQKQRQLELCIGFNIEHKPRFSPIPENVIIPDDMIAYYNQFYRKLRLNELNKIFNEFKLNDLWDIVNDFLDVLNIKDDGSGVLQDD